MKQFVIDASVLIKIFLKEEHSDACERAVQDAHKLVAPDLLWIECASVLRKHVHADELAVAEASEIMLKILRQPVDTYPSWSLIQHALRISLETGRSVYDCMYVALAVQEDCQLLTADERLCNALAKHPLAARLHFVDQQSD